MIQTPKIDAKALAGQTGSRRAPMIVKSVNDDDRAFDWVISTASVDRDGEVMVPRGAKWKNFLLAGGGVTWMHNDHEYPIAKAMSISHGEDEIVARVRFPETPDTIEDPDNWEPNYVLGLVKSDMVRATSVKFMRLMDGVREATNADRKKYGDECYIVTSKWEMLNFSLVNIPANPEALRKCVDGGFVSAVAAKRFGGVEIPPASNRAVIVVPKFGTFDIAKRQTERAVAKARGLIYLRR